MFKDHIHKGTSLENFTRRGQGGSRIESLSDGVFALAIAMLLLSTSVPANFAELWLFASDIFSFGICSIFVYWIWRTQVLFFQRYGLTEEQYVLRLSFLLIMLVPYYIYALKFLMSWLVGFFGAAGKSLLFGIPFFESAGYLMGLINMTEMPWLMCIYAIGFSGVFLVFTLLYNFVLKHQEALNLSIQEKIETQYSYQQYIGLVGVGLLAFFFGVLGIVFTWPWAGFVSGMSYNLIPLITFRQLRWRKKKLAELND